MRVAGKIGAFGRMILVEFLGLVGDVPEELEICEFHCAQPECRHGDWEVCPLRKARPVSLN